MLSHCNLEEGKDLIPVRGNKGDELTSKNKEVLEADPVSSDVEKSEVKDSNETKEKTEEVKTVDSEKEAEEVMVCDVVEISHDENEDDAEEEKMKAASNETAETVEDVTANEKVMQCSDDECEVTSPDVIPSSQTPSFESPFQSLRRVMIPLEAILPSSVETLRNKGNSGRKQHEKTEGEPRSQEAEAVLETKSDALETNEADELSSGKQEEPSSIKTLVSPIARRTRRRLQRKSDIDRTPSRQTKTKPEDDHGEQEVSELTHKEKDSEEAGKLNKPIVTTKPAEVNFAGVTRDATSSPVLSTKNKFLRPFAAGGSPCRVTLRGRNSPGVSPTTGILKRWPGSKQAVDSPSPPGKVCFSGS